MAEADSLFNLVRKEFRSDIVLAEKYALASLAIYQKYQELNKTILNCNALSSIYYNTSQITKAAEYAERALSLLESSEEVSKKNAIRSKNNYAALLKELGNYAGAIYHLEKLSEEKKLDSLTRVALHTNLSANYNWIQDFENAEFHFDLANTFLPKKAEVQFPFRLYHPKAIRLFQTNKFEECITLLKNLLSNPKFGLKKSSKATAYRWLAKAYLKSDNPELAFSAIDSSYNNCTDEDYYEILRSEMFWGDIYFETKNFQEANSKYLQAQKTLNKDSLQVNPPIQAQLLNKMAQAQSKLGNLTSAIQLINQSIETLKINLNDEIEVFIADKILYRESLYLKATFMQMAEEDAEDVAAAFNNAILMVIESRKDINSLTSKVNDGLNSRLIFEDAIDYAYQSFQNTKNKKWLWQALEWSDQSKSMTLSESKNQHSLMRNYKEDSVYNVYVNEYSKLQALVLQADELRHNKEKDSTYLNVINQILAKQNRIKLLTDKKTNNPNFRPIDLIKYQSHLNFIEIFAGANHYYFFSNVKGNLIANKIEKAIVETTCQNIASKISSPETQSATNNSQENKYLLIQEWLNTEIFIDAKSQNLYVIPDGSFFNIPFEILPCGKTNFLNQKSLVYSYSLNSLSNPNKQSSFENVLGFAPNFEENKNYPKLHCNEKELKAIENNFNLISFIQDNATVSNLSSNLDQADLVHFATHAIIDQNHHLKNHIVLSEDQLLIADLYKYDWKNKAVVLSACSTGQGKQVSGEGVFSMARTLIELGCQEVLVSLWPIDDCVSKDLMTSLYTHLPKEKTLANSLKKAKTEFINTSQDHLKDPFYWSSFIVFTSSSEPIHFNGKAYLILGSLLLLIIFFGKKFQSKTQIKKTLG